MAKKSEPSHAYPKYDPLTGLFHGASGRTVGTTFSNGYVYVTVRGVHKLAHRLAYEQMTGHLPENDIDHINGDRTDNRWSNLRPATRQENMFNKGSTRDLPKNVYRHRSGKYRVKMKVDKITIHGGYYDSLEEAAQAAIQLQIKHHGEWARG